MPKKPTRTAIRRRARTERTERTERRAPAGNDYAQEILRELERAGEPLTEKELGERLSIRSRERRAFDQGLATLQPSGAESEAVSWEAVDSSFGTRTVVSAVKASPGWPRAASSNATYEHFTKFSFPPPPRRFVRPPHDGHRRPA